MSAVLKPAGAAFRPMSEADLPRIIEIEQAAYDYPWTEGIFRDCLRVGYCCWLMEDDMEGTVAYGIMSVAVGEAHLLNLCVAPTHRRRGLGRAMLQHLLHTARRHGAETLFLEVRPSNVSARRLYDEVGFNEVGMRRKYYPARNHTREDALILALTLKWTRWGYGRSSNPPKK